jgi:hypothetical protein
LNVSFLIRWCWLVYSDVYLDTFSSTPS